MDEADNVEVAVATEAPVSSRPEWLPEKFESPEAMAKSYGELESWKGKREEDLRSELISEMEKEAYQADQLQLVTMLFQKLLMKNLQLIMRCFNGGQSMPMKMAIVRKSLKMALNNSMKH